jgi:AraC-like DNA-binding protein
MTRLLCGAFSLGEQGSGLLAYLPRVLHIDGQSIAATRWLSPMLVALQGDHERGKPGTAAVQDKVAEVFVTQAVRVWLLTGEQSGFFTPNLVPNDHEIAAALSMLCSDVAHSWTIDELASSVALSRSALVIRFRRVVGESPMRYLAQLRMSRAAALLMTSQLSVREIAEATGYGNEASLSKAFKRKVGHSPGAYRSAARVGDVVPMSDRGRGELSPTDAS